MLKDFIFTDEKGTKYLVLNSGTEQFKRYFDILMEQCSDTNEKFFNDHYDNIVSFQFSNLEKPGFDYWCKCEVNAINENKENYLLCSFDTHLPDLIEIFGKALDISFLTTDEVYNQLLNDNQEIVLDTPEVEPETKEITKDDLLEIIDEPETTVLNQNSQDEVVYTEPKKKRGRPVKGVVQAVVETIKEVLDFTKQKSKITVAEKNDERIILSYDRHKEKYEVIKDRYEPIGYVEPFKEVVKRGLVPEMSKDALVYGQSYKMETPVERCLRVKKQLANAEKQLKDVNTSINQFNEQNIKLQEQLNTQVNNTDKGEQK